MQESIGDLKSALMESLASIEKISHQTLSRVSNLNGITSEDKDAFAELAKVCM